MSDILDELRRRDYRMVDGVATLYVEVPEELLRRAAREIEDLRLQCDALQGDIMSAGL